MSQAARSCSRAWLLMLRLAACASPEEPEPVPLTLPMQIVVNTGEIRVYMEGADLSGCWCTPETFPARGQCSFLTDAGPCSGTSGCTSCITEIYVEADGVGLPATGYRRKDPLEIPYGQFPPGDLSLVIAGCGHPETRIPLGPTPSVDTTATADYVNGIAHASWNSDPPTTDALLTLYGTHGDFCSVTGPSDYTFDTWQYGLLVMVEPVLTTTELTTEFGPATVWRTGWAEAMFPN